MRIRMATADDAAAARAIYGPVIESTAISFELVVPSVEEMATRITRRQPAYPWLVAEDASEVVGYVYAGRFADRAAYDWFVETSAYIGEAARGRGVGRALYTSLLALLTAQGFRQAIAGVALPNAASVGLHESVGFERIGTYREAGWKLGSWHDVGWWQRPLCLREGAPPPPLTLTGLPPGVLDAALAAGEQMLR